VVMASRIDRKLAAVMAVDVVGYSRLVGKDEAGTLARVKAHRVEFAEPLIAEHRGRVVKLTGDGALVEFASAVDAVECAVAIQTGMAVREADQPEDRRIRYRIGINLGDIVLEDDDIFGDGVNVAARLETLVEPGGICIARSVHDQVKAKLDLAFAPMGRHRVKNITEPIEVWRVVLDGARWQPMRRSPYHRGRGMIATAAATVILLAAGTVIAWLQPWRAAPQEAAAIHDAAWDLPSKPSIAVLPFANLNNDPEQDYFIDGITNDIITDISKFSDLFVIAANSTFRYKNKPVDVREVARDLGVRYVLEGSIQRVDDTLRINAQLVDATTGAHVWAERYDRAAKDFFAIQNEITSNVVGAIYPLAGGTGRLRQAELDRIARTPTENLGAYDYFLRGMDHVHRFTKEDNLQARALFEKALELDQGYARAAGKLTWTYLFDYYNGWSDTPDAALEKALEVARRAIAIDPNEPWAHYALASVYLMEKRHDQALNEYQKAHELNPNDANMVTEYGWGLTWAGRAEEGIPLMLEAMRLNPHYPNWYLTSLADGYFALSRYEDMVDTLEKVSEPYPHYYRRLAVGYAHLGRIEEARAALAKYRKGEPQASIEFLVETMPFKRREDLDRFLDGMRKAGLPEKSPAPGT
jgi:adenylate cyclase